jgi:hypothetical protein
MVGIEVYEIVLFVKQLGFVLAGAASLWGFIFSLKDFTCGENECILYDWIALRLFTLFIGGLTLGALGLLGALSMLTTHAHEGIVILPDKTETLTALLMSAPILLILIAGTIIIMYMRHRHPENFSRLITPFFAFSFVGLFILASLTAWGDGLRENLFFIGHGFHSIFTLGSVLVLDSLFLLSRKSNHLKSHIYPLFPTISKVIWAGLFFDFLSSYLILPEFVITQKFFFMQTVIGILIINGVILSGPIARKLIATVGKELQGKWRIAANIAGAISITSWMTITFVDFFKNLSLGYLSLVGSYLLLILFVFSMHYLLEKFEEEKSAPEFAR